MGIRLVVILVAGSLWLPGSRLQGQVFHDEAFRAEAARGLDLTYNFAFGEATEVFRALKVRYPGHPAPHFLLATNLWWQSYISTTTAYHDRIHAQVDSVLALNEPLRGRPGYELEYTFFQYMAHALRTRLYILRQEWFYAANAGRKALPYLKEGLRYAQQSPEFYFSAGIYHYYAATYPEEHYYVRPFMMFFPDGDARLGLAELDRAARTPNYTQAEAMYYLGDIYLHGEGDTARALALKGDLHRRYPRNTWFQLSYARALVLAGRLAEGQALLDPLVAAFERLPGHRDRRLSSQETRFTTLVLQYAYATRGQARVRLGDQAAAERDLRASLRCHALGHRPEDPYLPEAWFFLGECLRAQGRKGEAQAAYRRCLDLPANQAVRAAAAAALAD